MTFATMAARAAVLWVIITGTALIASGMAWVMAIDPAVSQWLALLLVAALIALAVVWVLYTISTGEVLYYAFKLRQSTREIERLRDEIEIQAEALRLLNPDPSTR